MRFSAFTAVPSAIDSEMALEASLRRLIDRQLKTGGGCGGNAATGYYARPGDRGGISTSAAFGSCRCAATAPR